MAVPWGFSHNDNISYGRVFRATFNDIITNTASSSSGIVQEYGQGLGNTNDQLYITPYSGANITNVVVGKAYSFNNGFGYANAYNSVSAFPFTNLTFSCWFTPTATQTGLFQAGVQSTGNVGWDVDVGPAGTVLFYPVNGTGAYSTCVATNGDKLFLVVVYGNVYATVYLYDATNGSLQINTITTPTAGTLANGGCIIGGNPNITYPANANIDEVCVWNRQLSTNEITQMYNAGYSLP
jgi:hypothetical protein